MIIDEEDKDKVGSDADDIKDEDFDIDDIDLGDDDDDDDSDDDKDWKAEALKNKAIAKRLANKIKKSAPADDKKDDDTPAPKPNVKVVENKKPSASLTEDDVDARLEAKLFKRDLDALDVSENIRGEIKKYAELNKVSVAEASKSTYISFLQEEEAKKKKIEDATISSSRKSQPRKDFADAKPSDFDLTTKEGREDWSAYKAWLKTQ